MMKTKPSFLSILALCCISGAALHAETIVEWGGSVDGSPTVGSNWVGGHQPQTGVSGASAESARISSGSVYQSSSSLNVCYGNSLILNGGNYTLASGISTYFYGTSSAGDGGSMIIKSGTFTAVSAGIKFDSNSQFTVSGGMASFAGPVQMNGGTFSLSAGVVTTTGDFSFSSLSNTVSGGELSMNYLGLASVSNTVLTLSGGDILTDRIYFSTGTYINFTLASTASLFIGTYTKLSDIQALITSGKIRYNGIDNALAADDLANFVITAGVANTPGMTSNDGYYITLASVPEPSTAGLLGLSGLGILAFWRKLARAGKAHA